MGFAQALCRWFVSQDIPKNISTADEFEWRFKNRENPYLFRDTLCKLLGASKLEYKELIAA